jgi:hypothetical protein
MRRYKPIALRVCCQTALGGIEIATAPVLSCESKNGGLAMTKKSGLCHYEERSDEAISAFSTAPMYPKTIVSRPILSRFVRSNIFWKFTFWCVSFA